MSSVPPQPPSPARATPVAAEHDVLPPGTRFGEFEILRVLGVGGFGIVYLAMDHSLQREVALKEYMPAALAVRGDGPQITIRSGAHSETYAIGLRSFVNEARLLARFDHPSLVKVYRFWEDNATAYMVMPYLQGRTLRDKRRELGSAPDETWLRGLLDPLLGAIEVMHREGVYHRDIAPDNILLPPGAPPVLLDFGAARRVISDRTQTLTAILKPSYAPIEQYADMTQLRQGPWTDLYAVGAVLHFALLGTPPPPATARALEDELVPLAQRHFPGMSQRFLLAIDWALAVRPADRPQSVEAMRAALDGRSPVPAGVLQRAAMVRTPSSADAAAYDTTLHLGHPGTLPTQADTAHQATMPMQPTLPMQATVPMQPTLPMQPTVPLSAMAATQPMLATRPMLATQAAAVMQAMPSGEAMVTPLAASAAVGSGQWPQPAAKAAAVPLDSEEFRAAVEHSSARKSKRFMILMAAVVVAAAVAGGLGWKFGASRPPQAAAPGPAIATPPAATALNAAPVTVAVPAVSVPAATVQQAAPATPVVAAPTQAPPSPTAGPPAAVKAPTDSSPAAPAKPSVAAVPRAQATAKPVVKPAAVAAEPAAPATYGANQPPLERQPVALAAPPERTQAQPPVAQPLPAPAPAAASAASADVAEPKNAREACGKRVLVALWQCMERECEKPRYRNQAQCAETLNNKRAREGG